MNESRKQLCETPVSKMMISNLPALRQWLTAILKPLCDADPEALTKYVIALLKKDIPDTALRKSMEEQLDIFLQGETVPFVTRLFECIRNKEYENQADAETLDESSLVIESANVSDQPSEVTSEIENTVTSTACDDSLVIPKTLDEYSFEHVMSVCSPVATGGNDDHSSTDTDSSDTEMQDPKTENFSVEKTRRWRDKRSRSTSSEISPHGKRKCVTSASKKSGRGEDWDRHQWSPIKRRIRRDIQRRRRVRSPRPLRSRSATRNTQLLSRSAGGVSRSRSGSPAKHRRISIADSSKPGWNPPSPEGNTCNSLLDNITNKCSVKSVIVKPDTGKRTAPTLSRCVDFDEKGVCLRGELCPYDHGSDPVILHEVVNNDNCSSPNFSGKIPPSDKPAFMNEMVPPPPRPSVPTADEYYPESPSIGPPPPAHIPPFGWGIPRRPLRGRHLGMPFLGRGGMIRPSIMHAGPPMFHGQRQLITIPVEGMHHRGPPPGMGMLPENPFAIGGARMVCRALFGMRGRGRGSFDHNRLGPRPSKNNGNCCLEVRKIPRELNKIESLINHFSRFGNVVSIQISFDNDPEGALVTFYSHLDAMNAYRSTDAVLNNRFIKVYWYNKEIVSSTKNGNSLDNILDRTKQVDENMQEGVPRGPTTISLHKQYFDKEVDVMATEAFDQNEIIVPPEEDDEAVLSPRILTQQAVQESPAVKPFKRSNASSAAELQRKQEMMALMNAQIQEQKQLISKLESDRARMTPKQRDEVFKIIKDLQASYEQLKANIGSTCKTSSDRSVEPATRCPPTRQSENDSSKRPPKDEIRRKLLDAELAMYMSERRCQEAVELEENMLNLECENEEY